MKQVLIWGMKKPGAWSRGTSTKWIVEDSCQSQRDQIGHFVGTHGVHIEHAEKNSFIVTVPDYKVQGIIDWASHCRIKIMAARERDGRTE